MSKSKSLRTIVLEDNFVSLSDERAVCLFHKAFEKELSHLRNAKSTVESGRIDSSSWTPSRVIYNKDYPEVNRTLTSTLAIKWLLANDYETFTSGQPRDKKLSPESFGKLQNFCLDRLPTQEDVYTLIVAMVIDDIGKDEALAGKLKMTGKNHSEVLLCAVEEGDVPALETIEEVDKKKAIIESLKIGAKLDVSQIMQGETAACSMVGLRDCGENAFNIKAMVTFLDVAGAAAHKVPRGCVVVTENVFQNYMNTIEQLDVYRKDKGCSEKDCYNHILTHRAQALKDNGIKALELSPEVPDQRAFLRIICMGRVEDREDAELFWNAFDRLPTPTKKVLVDGLNVNGVGDGVAVLPYYAPGLLSEALKNTKSTNKVPALVAFMKFLAKVFDGYKDESGRRDGVSEHDLSFAQEVVKSEKFRNDPDVLAQLPLK
ncbi:hypothetical protein BBP40_009899 [Aspergillus hancockii]|nr:hypothetical protein BBP40_009899 [Aspergillus hancockii]